MGAALAPVLVLAALVPASGALALNGSALRCDQHTLYGIDNSGAVKAIDTGSGAITDEATFSASSNGTTVTASNALGIVDGGTTAYAVQASGGAIIQYDTASGSTQRVVGTAPTANGQTVIRGAYDPFNRIFYTATSGSSATVGAYDVSGSREIGSVGTISGLSGTSGDFAFSTTGQLFVVAGDEVRRADRAVMPTTAGTENITTTLLTSLPAGTSSPGIAFSSDGFLYVASNAGRTSGAQVYKINPSTGALDSTITLSNTSWIPRDLASCNYANTVTGRSTVAERVRSTDQFTVTVTGGGIAGGNTATSSGTATSTTAGPVLGLAGETYTVTQSAAGTTKPEEYGTTWQCTRASDPGNPVASGTGSVASFTMPAASGSRGTDVSCEFTNALKRTPVQIVSALGGPRIAAADQFRVGVQDAAGAAVAVPGTPVTTGTGATVTAGTGDSGATSVVVGRPVSLTQAMAQGSASAYGQYGKTISCTDPSGEQPAGDLPSGAQYTGSFSVTPAADSQIVCTVSANAAPASIAVETTLGDARFRDADQFTAAIHDGPATGQVVGTTGRATTTGSGSTVDSGTGTTAFGTATAGSPYALTHTASGDAGRYVRAVTCQDANGFQDPATLPSGAFTDGATVTPVAGADITCSVRVMLKGAGLRIDAGLTDPRFDDGDQFTAAIRTGGANGPVVNSVSHSTTTGSGDRVDAGTGTTLLTPVDRATTYTITASPSAHPGRYEQTLTCDDLTRQQQGLPSAVPFTGSYDLQVEAGASVLCTVNAAAKHATVSMSTQLGSDRFDAGDQFTTGVQDANGTDRGAAATETSTGSGSTIDAGTGTTGDAAVPANLAYTLLGSPIAHGDRYDRTIACTDPAGGTTGLPSGAFDGSETVTPLAGAQISCVVTTTMKAASLTVATALGSSRYADGDQWTVAWRTGGATGTVIGGTSSATTTGSGSTVDPGTGVSGPVAATDGIAYTLTQSVSANAAQYTSRLTCRDANGLQTGLPQGVAFTGTQVITPEAGADVRCSITDVLAAPVLTVHLAGPASAQVGEVATYTATLVDDGGAAARGVVTIALPTGLAYTAVRGTGWSCSATASTVTCTGPDVAGGATSALQLDLTPARGSEGHAVVRAAVDHAGAGAPTDPSTCTGTDTPFAGCDAVDTLVGSTPHLTLGITAPGSAAVGAPATWKAVVGDDGTGAAGGSTVALRLPAGLTDVTATGATCTVTGQDAVCAVPGPIAFGATTAFTVTGVPAASAAGTAAVLRGRLDPAGSTTTGDPSVCTTDDAATGCAVAAPVTVATGIALGVAITAPTALTEGVPAGYTVAVTNSGTGAAAKAVVSVHLPDGLVYRGATGADCTATGGDLTCTLPGALPAGGTTSFVVTVQPDPGTAGTTVAPAASVNPAGGAPAPASACTAGAKGCAVAPGRTIGQTGLVLVGTVKPVAPAGAQLAAGGRVRYAFTVTNRTGAALTRVGVTVPGLGRADCDATSLAAGDSTTCELGPVVVTQAQIDSGTVTRDATATGTPAGCTGTCAPARSNTVTLMAPVKAVARISAVQTVQLQDRNGDGVAQLGERVTFRVTVTNTGTVTLHGVALSDSAVAMRCAASTLAVGESTVCTGTRTTTAADVAAGGIRNVAIASARGVAKLGTVSSQRTVGSVQADGPTARLAHTGSSLPAGLLAGGVLLVLGGVLLVATRRRRRTA